MRPHTEKNAGDAWETRREDGSKYMIDGIGDLHLKNIYIGLISI